MNENKMEIKLLVNYLIGNGYQFEKILENDENVMIAIAEFSNISSCSYLKVFIQFDMRADMDNVDLHSFIKNMIDSKENHPNPNKLVSTKNFSSLEKKIEKIEKTYMKKNDSK
jgi:hypothetical protein